ncbi:MAG: hypothetical protein J5526_04385 [Bacteroidales bacterium]|nr:hypothetical protein [Bacteroidales bacterium]
MKRVVFLIMVVGLVGMVGCDRHDDTTDNPINPSVGGFDQNGASNAVFTVASGRTVKFSKGNLQYQASTGTWRFAEHQYDCIGADNANISSAYSGWIDLFGWGTSGWNGSFAVCYQPWATSTSSFDYWIGGVSSYNLTEAYTNADWGVYNAISNGGNQSGMWRTLTKDEWSYLLDGRGSAYRYALANVNGVNGLIIFPDTFTIPVGVTITNINVISTSYGYSSNIYTESQWNQMESCGYIFLPAAGDRSGTEVNHVGTYGLYWSSSYNDRYDALCMFFFSGYACMNYGSRYSGLSVRLVRD